MDTFRTATTFGYTTQVQYNAIAVKSLSLGLVRIMHRRKTVGFLDHFQNIIA
jgi:hypothetical protein